MGGQTLKPFYHVDMDYHVNAHTPKITGPVLLSSFYRGGNLGIRKIKERVQG